MKFLKQKSLINNLKHSVTDLKDLIMQVELMQNKKRLIITIRKGVGRIAE